MLLLVDVKQTGRRFKSWVSVLDLCVCLCLTFYIFKSVSITFNFLILSFISRYFFLVSRLQNKHVIIMMMADREKYRLMALERDP